MTGATLCYRTINAPEISAQLEAHLLQESDIVGIAYDKHFMFEHGAIPPNLSLNSTA